MIKNNFGHDGHRHGYVGVACINTCKPSNYGGLVRAAHNFNANLLMFVGRRFKQQPSDTVKSERHVPLLEYQNSDDFLEHILVGCRLVSVEISNKSVSIVNFQHPKQVIYVFGPEDGNIPVNILNVSQSIIQIPSNHCLNLACAVSVVLYDRLIKGRSPQAKEESVSELNTELESLTRNE